MKYPFVSARDAVLTRLANKLPVIPNDIASEDNPITGLNGIKTGEFYRKNGVWHYRNQASGFLRGLWTRGDVAFQNQLTLSYVAETD